MPTAEAELGFVLFDFNNSNLKSDDFVLRASAFKLDVLLVVSLASICASNLSSASKSCKASAIGKSRDIVPCRIAHTLSQNGIYFPVIFINRYILHVATPHTLAAEPLPVENGSWKG